MRSPSVRRGASLLAVLAAALLCGGGCVAPAGAAGVGDERRPGGGKADGDGDGDGPAGGQDLLATSLRFDLEANEGVADITAVPSADGSLGLSVGDLELLDVATAAGAPVEHTREGDTLRIQLGEARGVTELTIAYRFRDHSRSDGWTPASGTTMLWPYFCGNLFPCDPRPREGVVFDLELAGVPDGEVAVIPPAIAGEAPPYSVAFAVGDYVYEALGTTRAGTEVGVYHHRGDETVARRGTEHLVGVFEFLETTYGAYTFGERVASVSADWGGGAYGGMEHHPYWHVARGAMGNAETHAHEAAHGWFGNGVRIRCWEDFVLSEGVTSYAAARAIEAVGGETAGAAVWADYRDRLEGAVRSGDTEAWPEGCDRIDILHHPLWSSVPYMKGAFFLRAVAEVVGVEALDGVLARFYEERVGTAAGVSDLLDTIEAETGFDPTPLADAWLRSRGIPDAG